MKKPLYLSVALISAALISYQVVLMHVLSIIQWHHFAYMIISAAMLGFGASGTFLALFKNRGFFKTRGIIFFLLVFSSAAISFSIAAVSLPGLSFDSYRVLTETPHMLRLALSYGIFFIPFLSGALVIALLFVRHSENTSRLYFSNLLGSAAGAVVPLALISNFAPEKLIPFIALIPLLSALPALPRERKKISLLFFSAAAAVSILLIFRGPSLHISQYKGISYALNQPGAEIIDERRSVHGLLEYVRTPAKRFAPGLSLAYEGEIPKANMLFLNSEEFGPVFKHKEDYAIFNHTPKALAFKLAAARSALVLEGSTFYSAFFALKQKTQDITVAGVLAGEVNSVLAKHTELDTSGFNLKSVNAKTFLFTAEEQYDLITLPPANTFRGTAGLYALQEKYTLTLQSIRKMIHLLNEEGFIYIPVWTDHPPRAPLKLLATITRSLEKEGLGAENHLAVLRDWNMVHFFVAKSPLTQTHIRQTKEFSREKMFDIAVLEGPTEEPDKFHQLEDDNFFYFVSQILSEEREDFIAGYKFNISPPTDDKPFFNNFLTLRATRDIIRTEGFRNFSFMELGYMILLFAFFQVSAAALVFILLPLLKLKKKLKNKFFSIVYFSCLGLGFIFLEMVLIQKFTLYFGSPIYAAAFIMAFMLGASGAGSYMSSKINAVPGNILKICLSVFIVVLGVSFLIDAVFHRTIAFPLEIKALITFAMVFPAAFLMGMPFPLGLKFIGGKNTSNIPWCWGIDGCLSVIAAVLASIISVNLGFTFVIFSVSALYLLAAYAAFACD